MSEISRIAVDELALTIYTERGQVVGATKWATTEISGGGTSGYVHQGTGYSSSRPITSKTTEHDQFFVRTGEGKEIPIRLQNANVALRDGQDLSLFWGVGEGRQSGPYIAFHNHTTDETTWLPERGNELFGVGVTIRFLLPALVLIAGVILTIVALANASLVGAAVCGAISWFSWVSVRKTFIKYKKLQTEMRAAVTRSIGAAAR